MSYTVDFIGLVNFYRSEQETKEKESGRPRERMRRQSTASRRSEKGGQEREVLLPDGRNPNDGIASHFARFSVLEEMILDDAADWWPSTVNERFGVPNLPIQEKSIIAIDGQDSLPM